jgi:hypothetical protein
LGQADKQGWFILDLRIPPTPLALKFCALHQNCGGSISQRFAATRSGFLRAVRIQRSGAADLFVLQFGQPVTRQRNRNRGRTPMTHFY